MATQHPLEDFAQSILDALFFSMLELDKASRNLGEEEVKGDLAKDLSSAGLATIATPRRRRIIDE